MAAAVFSQGFLASDDHHVVINAADQIATGTGLPTTYARSALFPAAVATIMAVTRAIGIHDPGVEMLIVRLIQAAYSLLVVFLVYRILERASGRESAVLGGLLAAAFFAMPMTAVHQLEESVCQAPLLAACWWWQRAEDGHQPSAGWAALAGSMLGLALILRFPLIGFVAAFAVVALLRPVKAADKAAFVGGIALILVLQGFSNTIVNDQWGYSFIHRLGAMLRPQQMALESDGYPSGPPWHYLLTLLAALIPPVSILLLAAAVNGARQLSMLGIATLAFLVSHSVIANKQERFLLPILPILFILIVAGLPWLAAQIRFRQAYRGMWWYFWIVNAALLTVLTLSFSKKDRVAPLLYVYRRHDPERGGVVIAQFNQTFRVPEYYLGRARRPILVLEQGDAIQPPAFPITYVILYSDAPQADAAALARAFDRELRLLTVVTPSLADRLAHAINPRHNKARTASIYTTL